MGVKIQSIRFYEREQISASQADQLCEIRARAAERLRIIDEKIDTLRAIRKSLLD